MYVESYFYIQLFDSPLSDAFAHRVLHQYRSQRVAANNFQQGHLLHCGKH